MTNRHNKLGIKQTIQKHWMDYVVKLLLAELSENEIRSELKKFLATQKQSGGRGKRGERTFEMAIAPLSSWFSPCKELTALRDKALALIQREKTENWLPYHWAILSASYPFWFSVARQTGKLFNLQAMVTQEQIRYRLMNQFGDRITVARNARYTIRSFVAWGVLADSEKKGYYQQNGKITISDPNLEILLYEAALHAERDGKSTLGLITNNPAFFPFDLSVLSGDVISQKNTNIEVIRLGLNEELLKLK